MTWVRDQGSIICHINYPLVLYSWKTLPYLTSSRFLLCYCSGFLLPDNSNFPVISECGPNACSMSSNFVLCLLVCLVIFMGSQTWHTRLKGLHCPVWGQGKHLSPKTVNLACASQHPFLQMGWDGRSVLELGIYLFQVGYALTKHPKVRHWLNISQGQTLFTISDYFFQFYHNYFSTPPFWKPKEISPQHFLWECGRSFGGKTHKRLNSLGFVSFLLVHTELPANTQTEVKFFYRSPGFCKGYCLWWIIWNSKNLPGDHSISETNIYLFSKW